MRKPPRRGESSAGNGSRSGVVDVVRDSLLSSSPLDGHLTWLALGCVCVFVVGALERCAASVRGGSQAPDPRDCLTSGIFSSPGTQHCRHGGK